MTLIRGFGAEQGVETANASLLTFRLDQTSGSTARTRPLHGRWGRLHESRVAGRGSRLSATLRC